MWAEGLGCSEGCFTLHFQWKACYLLFKAASNAWKLCWFFINNCWNDLFGFLAVWCGCHPVTVSPSAWRGAELTKLGSEPLVTKTVRGDRRFHMTSGDMLRILTQKFKSQSLNEVQPFQQKVRASDSELKCCQCFLLWPWLRARLSSFLKVKSAIHDSMILVTSIYRKIAMLLL